MPYAQDEAGEKRETAPPGDQRPALDRRRFLKIALISGAGAAFACACAAVGRAVLGPFSRALWSTPLPCRNPAFTANAHPDGGLVCWTQTPAGRIAYVLDRDAAFVWRACDGRTGGQEITRRLSEATGTGLSDGQEIFAACLQELVSVELVTLNHRVIRVARRVMGEGWRRGK